MFYDNKSLVNFKGLATVEALNALESRLEEKLQSANERLDNTDERLTNFAESYAVNREQDMLAFADQSERSDFTSNQSKANFVLITGKMIRCYVGLIND